MDILVRTPSTTFKETQPKDGASQVVTQLEHTDENNGTPCLDILGGTPSTTVNEIQPKDVASQVVTQLEHTDKNEGTPFWIYWEELHQPLLKKTNLKMLNHRLSHYWNIKPNQRENSISVALKMTLVHSLPCSPNLFTTNFRCFVTPNV